MLVILRFVKNRACSGNRKLNPFNFEHFNINFLSLSGVQIPGKPLQPRFENSGCGYIEAFHTVFTDSRIHLLNEGIDVNNVTYHAGYCLFAFDLTPDLSAYFTSHWNLMRSGSLRIEVRFAQALTETINCVVYADFDNVLEIESIRQIIMDFNT